MDSFVNVLGLSPFDVDVLRTVLYSVADCYALYLTARHCSTSHEGHLEVEVLNVGSCGRWVDGGSWLRRYSFRYRFHVTRCRSFCLSQVLSTSHPQRSKPLYMQFSHISYRRTCQLLSFCRCFVFVIRPRNISKVFVFLHF